MSQHVLERAFEREISQEVIISILTNPDQVVDDESGEIGQKVYQSIVKLSGKVLI